MKIIFCLLSDQGHVNPYIGPAQALLQRNHDVLVTSFGNLSAQMRKAGIPFSSALVPATAAPAPRGLELVEMIEDRALHRSIIEKFFLKDIRSQVAPLQEFLTAEKPDAIVVDPMNYSAIIAAQTLGIPWISMSSSLTSVLPKDLRSDVLEIIHALSLAREEIFLNYGFLPQFRAVDCLSPTLNITFATSSFIGDAPKEVDLVGPSVPLHARGDEVDYGQLPQLSTDLPLIYISFGSQVFHYPEIFKKIIAATKELSVQLILSIGDLIDEPGWENTEKCIFYRYAPQLEILPQTSLFITHGGANSVMEGLRAGTPLLVFPICNDQYHQAYFIERCKVGRAIDLRTATPEEIKKLIMLLLGDAEIKNRSVSISADYQANGAIKAADLIEAQLSRRGSAAERIPSPAD